MGYRRTSISGIFLIKGRKGARGLQSSPITNSIHGTCSTKEPKAPSAHRAQEGLGRQRVGQGGGARPGSTQDVNHIHTSRQMEAQKTDPPKEWGRVRRRIAERRMGRKQWVEAPGGFSMNKSTLPTKTSRCRLLFVRCASDPFLGTTGVQCFITGPWGQ